MGIFNFFKKSKEKSIIDFTLNDLKKGFVLDYFLKTWEVKSEYHYDWGNNCFAKEFLLDAGDESLYLYIEEEDQPQFSIWKPIRITDIEPDILAHFANNDEAPHSITYDEKTYKKTSAAQGYGREDPEDDAYDELINWTYEEKQNKKLVSINRTGESEFEIFEGEEVKAFEFTNILPRITS